MSWPILTFKKKENCVNFDPIDANITAITSTGCQEYRMCNWDIWTGIGVLNSPMGVFGVFGMVIIY